MDTTHKARANLKATQGIEEEMYHTWSLVVVIKFIRDAECSHNLVVCKSLMLSVCIVREKVLMQGWKGDASKLK